jgi:prolyl 4-hydroxylase
MRELLTIENFLTNDECDELITMIDKDHTASYVATEGDTISEHQSDYRTSSTSMLSELSELVWDVKNRIATQLDVDIYKGQQMEGQLYEPGQFFKPHCDYFEGENYINNCLGSGNRTYTFMIYLNEPEEGGETNFPNLNQSIKPKKGMALVWNNLDEDGNGIPDFLHEGSEVKKGKKYIITSWWREKQYRPTYDEKLRIEYRENEKFDKLSEKVSKLNENILNPIKNKFTSYDDFPRFTSNGFKVVKCPDEVWGLIQDSYELLKDKKVEEYYEGKEQTILGIGNTSDILSFHLIPNIRDHIHKLLQPLHEEFAGQRIEPSAVYGIRSYNKGAVLVEHKDRIETHHISSIIIVDKDLDCKCASNEKRDWPLNIQDHNGKRHRIYAEPGDIILYESAACNHGRVEPFMGTYFRNFYVHYKLTDWDYSPTN